ncbi:Nuclease-related domain-containing protein [Sanguibacter gelidistatuariae]|uniref:Nuclease-related domain-containing protein n=1 Tax=Sanguibacter gelidistatuariae TaxID=1814289 RepID=A0A1G6H9F9_9MICO|nr:nuclease-related domain-containing protein [Sanguibacter gelidistatuariae]SDB90738.1 Nuclease-related domain-containing protein [Sanguibacter gelidistatuariae]
MTTGEAPDAAGRGDGAAGVSASRSAAGTALGSAAGSASSGTLAGNVAGQSVMVEALRAQESAPERGWWARLTGRSPLTEDARPWYLGAVGEIRVAGLITRLGPEWMVLHAVPVGAGTSDIDHVLVGPAGVVTVNTKNHGTQRVWVAGKAFLVAGQKKPYIRNSEHEAARAAKLLTAAVGRPVTASAMIVVVDPKQMVVREKPASVAVVTSSGMLRALRAQARRGPALPAGDLEALRAAAIEPRTWHRAPAPAIDTADLQSRFGRLHRAVTGARRRRTAWRFVGLLAVITVACAAYLAITSGLLDAIA